MNAVAALCAVLAAAGFALAAVAQHRASRWTRDLRVLVRRPLWLLGSAAAAAGAGLHAVALGLAPVALVQPIGVLAVPLGVLAERRLAAREHAATGSPVSDPPVSDPRRGTDPAGRGGAGVLAGIGLALVGVAVFVVAASGSVPGGPVEPFSLLLVGGALAVAGAVAAHLSGRMPPTLRCLARAVPAAIAFGLVSALLRAGLAYRGQAGAEPAVLVAIGAAILLALAAGGLGVQLSYRSGPPSLVLACLTVLDPIVAVGFGVGALGERIGSGGADTATAVAGALLAVAGVVLLARHHPGARTSGAHLPGTRGPEIGRAHV